MRAQSYTTHNPQNAISPIVLIACTGQNQMHLDKPGVDVWAGERVPIHTDHSRKMSDGNGHHLAKE